MVRGTVVSATTSVEAAPTWDSVQVATTEPRGANLRLVISQWKSSGEESWLSSRGPVEVVLSRVLSTRVKGELGPCD